MNPDKKSQFSGGVLDETMDRVAEETERYLTFWVGEETFGVEIFSVVEIVGIDRITPVAGVPFYVRGVMNLRGNVVPVVDIRDRFSMDARDYDPRTCAIVVECRGQRVGLVVDRVREVVDFAASQIDNSSNVNTGDAAHFLNGIGKLDGSVTILINVDAVLFDGHDYVSNNDEYDHE